MIGAQLMPLVEAFLFGLLLIALVTDVTWLRIPNWISLAIAGLFFVKAALGPHPVEWWGSHFGAGLLVLAVGIAAFASGKIGGGDIKLLAAVAFWFGLASLPALLLVTGILGGVVALACLFLRNWGVGLFLEARGIRVESLDKGKGIPYAVAITTGCAVVFSGLPILNN